MVPDIRGHSRAALSCLRIRIGRSGGRSRGRRRSRWLSDHNDAPGADILEPVALDVAALAILHEPVKRPAAVADLYPSVGPLDGAEPADTSRLYTLRDDERLPEREAGRVLADEPAVPLDAQGVERQAL